MKTREELIKSLTEAGNKYSGHVTEGSMQEQMKIVDVILGDLNIAILQRDAKYWTDGS